MKLTSVRYFCCFFITCFCWILTTNAQSSAIEIVEEKGSKKVRFYAVNHTETEQEVFFKVDGKGFRKSGYRPIIKKVPAKKKVLLVSLIPLKNTTPEYTYFFSFDAQLQSINLEHDVSTWKTLDHLIDNGETIIFTKDACDKCEKLAGILKANHIKHKVFNISKNKRYEDFFWKTISKMKRKDVVISSIPIAIVNGKLHESLNLISFVEMLKD